MTAPENGTYYVADETPVITVTLADSATGDPIDSAFYTNPAGPAGQPGVGDMALSEANLFVYGPRSRAVPVLTTCSTTDSGFTDTPQSTACNGRTAALQGHELFVGSDINGVTDDQVETDSNGFKYQLMDDFAKLQPGTYMVRVEAADYGGISTNDYVTSSSGLITFQVGTADVEPKVSGNGCLNCHGDTIMHLEGAHAHHVPFDTDYCLACHDYSGNYGDYIGNRVHAVHHETFSGDTHNRRWTDVSFPQQANNCSICHTNSDAPVPVWRSTVPLACGGCHGTDPDAVFAADTYLAGNSDITDVEAQKVMLRAPKEAVAASHMLIMMGVGTGIQEDFVDYGSEPVPGCLVCHGAGQPQDLYQLMGLATFGIPNDIE